MHLLHLIVRNLCIETFSWPWKTAWASIESGHDIFYIYETVLGHQSSHSLESCILHEFKSEHRLSNSVNCSCVSLNVAKHSRWSRLNSYGYCGCLHFEDWADCEAPRCTFDSVAILLYDNYFDDKRWGFLCEWGMKKCKVLWVRF